MAEWDTANKRLDAAFAIVKMAQRANAAPTRDHVERLSTRLEQAALRFYITGGLVRVMPAREDTKALVGVSVRTVTALIRKIRGSVERARQHAWQLEHIAGVSLTYDRQPVVYGTDSQIQGAAMARGFLTNDVMADSAPAGLVMKLEELIAICDAAIDNMRDPPPQQRNITERHLFCFVVADIYTEVTGRKATASDGGDQAHISGVSPFVEFVADAWKITEGGGAPNGHAIQSMLTDRD